MIVKLSRKKQKLEILLACTLMLRDKKGFKVQCNENISSHPNT